MSVSMREIAKLAGVSSATVSRVLNGSALVSEETTRRIQQILDELHFVPNSSAIHLKRGKSHTYGIVIPDLTNPFFTELVKSFEELLVANNQELLIANTDLQLTRAQRSVHRMLMRRVDGVALLASEYETASLESLVKNRIPVVTADHYRISPGLSDIIVDFAGGMDQVVAHLRSLGHTRVGYIGGTKGLATSKVRSESFLNAIRKHGVSTRKSWITEGNYRVAGGVVAMGKILSQPDRPSAVVTVNDLTAIGALRAARERHLRVPEDISITGWDDIEMSDIVSPPLTTLRISLRQYAGMMMEALQATGEDLTQPGRQFTVPTTLIVRQSTGPAPAAAKEQQTREKKRARKAETTPLSTILPAGSDVN
jgi:LacI family transcriptional regulator